MYVCLWECSCVYVSACVCMRVCAHMCVGTFEDPKKALCLLELVTGICESPRMDAGI